MCWLLRFGSDVRHIFLNDECSDVGTEAPYRLQAILNHLHADIFPLLPHQQNVVSQILHIKL